MFEGMIRSTFKHAIGVELPAFPVMKHADAMRLYGSDKPDLRVKLEFTELTDVMKDVDFKVFSGPANAEDGRVVGAARARRRRDEPRRDRRLHRVRQDLRRQGPGLDQGQRRRPRAARACSRRSSRTCTTRRIAEIAQAHRRAERRPDLLRRRQGQGGQRRHRRAAREGRPQRVRQGAAAWSKGEWKPLWVVDFPMFEYDDDAPALERGAPPVHLAQGRPRGLAGDRSRPLHRQGLRRGAQRHRARRRLGAYPPRGGAEQGVPRAEDRRRGSAGSSSASCWTRCSTARRRTAASPSAWTASSC